MSQEYISGLFARAKRVWEILPRTSKEKLVYVDKKVDELENEYRNLWDNYTRLMSTVKDKDDKIKVLENENALLKDILESEDPVEIQE